MSYKNKEDRIKNQKEYRKTKKYKEYRNSPEYKKLQKAYNRKYQPQWRKDNPEKVKEQSKRYRENNREILRKKSREYDENHQLIYRKIVAEKLGRRLDIKEVVHHIDMNDTNNNPENLYVYINKSKHNRGHATLNKLVAHLLKENIIKFKDGKYKCVI